MNPVVPQNIKLPPRNLSATRTFAQSVAHAKPVVATVPRSTTPGHLGVPQPTLASMTQVKKPTIKNMPVRVTEEDVLGGMIDFVSDIKI